VAITKPANPGGAAPPGSAVEEADRPPPQPRGFGSAGGSRPAAGERRRVREVWLAGNARPVAAAALAVGVVITVLALVERSLRPGPPMASLGLACAAIGAIGTLAVVATRPRLERRGGVLRVRLMPLLSQDVPLEVVECFFFGVVPLGRSVEPCSGSGSDHPEPSADSGRDPDSPARGGRARDPHPDDGLAADSEAAVAARSRRATLIMRLAERERDWRSRPSLAAWGIWRHGAIAFDGLWCARLSPDVAADLTRRLVVARREMASHASTATVEESLD